MMAKTEQQKEYTPKRSAFFEQMKQAGIAPYYNPFFDEASKQAVLSTPSTNRGVTGVGECLPPSLAEALGFSKDKDYQPRENFKTIAVGKKGKFELIRVPVADAQTPANYAFIDWVNFTVKLDDYFNSPVFADVFNEHYDHSVENIYVADMSRHLIQIFGYGVTAKRPAGLNFYESSYDVGQNGWGHVCIGGQGGTMMVSIKGQGLLAAKSGWEKRLYDFMAQIPTAQLTRIDLAHDNFNSKKTLFDYFNMYVADLFSLSWRRPSIEKRGDWVNDNDKGRTLYIGKRESGKLLRIYEKGKQLGGGFAQMYPNWVRIELELHNEQRELPLEMLLKPGAFLAGGYPALKDLCKEQEVIETRKKSFKCTVDRMIEILHLQCGKRIKACCELFGIDKFFQIITHDVKELPKNLDSSDYSHFDIKNYLTNLNIEFKSLSDLTSELSEKIGGSFLDYDTFRLQLDTPF